MIVDLGWRLSAILYGDVDGEGKLAAMRNDPDATVMADDLIACRLCHRSFLVEEEELEHWVTHRVTCIFLRFVAFSGITVSDSDKTVQPVLTSGAGTRNGERPSEMVMVTMSPIPLHENVALTTSCAGLVANGSLRFVSYFAFADRRTHVVIMWEWSDARDMHEVTGTARLKRGR